MEHCSKEKTIDDIRQSTEHTHRAVSALEKVIERMCTSNERLVNEMRDLSQGISAHAADGREYAIRLKNTEDDVNVLFLRVRRIEDEKLPALESWQNRMRGALIVFPASCTAISILISLAALYIAFRS